MKRETAQRLLKQQVDQFREMAVVSTDTGVIAKAIAVSDSSVQDRIVQKLTNGEELSRVSILRALEPRRQRVFFETRNPSEPISLQRLGFLAIVDMATAAVESTLDPFALGDEETTAKLPFVLAVPSDSYGAIADASELQEMDQRGVTFFNNLELKPAGGTIFGSTIVGTITYSGSPTQRDDSKSDRLDNDRFTPY